MKNEFNKNIPWIIKKKIIAPPFYLGFLLREDTPVVLTT